MSFTENLLQHQPAMSGYWRTRHANSLAKLTGEGLPNRKNEDWKYTSLRKFNALDTKDFVAEAKAGQIINETPTLEITDRGVIVNSANLKVNAWSELATQNYSKIIEEHEQHASFVDDLNKLTLATAQVIEVNGKQNLTILDKLTGSAGAAACFLLFHVAKNASLNLAAEHVSAGAAYKNLRLFFVLDDNASVEFDRFFTADNRTVTFVKTNVQLGANAKFKIFDFMEGSTLLRNELLVKLNGEGAHADLSGAYVGTDEQHIDTHITMLHECPNATSSQVYRGVLNGRARAVFSGKVKVNQIAQGTNASQLSKTLMLSNEAEMDAKPQLEIDADDVKCGHGAAIARINPDELFYLQSRGYTAAAARQTLIRAFVDESLHNCHSPVYTQKLIERMTAKEIL